MLIKSSRKFGNLRIVGNGRVLEHVSVPIDIVSASSDDVFHKLMIQDRFVDLDEDAL